MKAEILWDWDVWDKLLDKMKLQSLESLESL